VPFGVREDAVIAGGIGAQYNGYAHSFAGMGIQFLLFAAIELGIGILLERELGIWKRFRSAPLSLYTLLAARAARGTIITLLTLVVSFAFAMIVFGVRIHGSVIGFAAIAVACSIMAATFGLLVAALGRTPAATRRVATFAVLGAVVRLPSLAAASHRSHSGEVGRGRPRRDDLAWSGHPRCSDANRRPAWFCRVVCGADRRPVPLGGSLNSRQTWFGKKLARRAPSPLTENSGTLQCPLVLKPALIA
jgi:hypothetical protein